MRPLTQYEVTDGCERTVVALDAATVMVGADRQFTFNHVLGETAAQEAVFDSVVRPLVFKCLEGYNATVFAYGQTVRCACACARFSRYELRASCRNTPSSMRYDLTMSA